MQRHRRWRPGDQPFDQRKEHLLFLHQVHRQFLRHRPENVLHLVQFRMIGAMTVHHLRQQSFNARTLTADEDVMRIEDVRDQFVERRLVPIPLRRRSGVRTIAVQRLHQFFQSHACLAGRLADRIAATAAIIDPVLFEHPGDTRIEHRHVGYGRFGTDLDRHAEILL